MADDLKDTTGRTFYQQRLREQSGKVESRDPLVAFLYNLMRDHVPPGIVGELLTKSRMTEKDGYDFTNGWLAQYAIHLAWELSTPGEEK